MTPALTRKDAWPTGAILPCHDCHRHEPVALVEPRPFCPAVVYHRVKSFDVRGSPLRSRNISVHRRTFLAAGLAGSFFTTNGLSHEPARKLTKADLPTPALLVDLDAFEANLRAMADHCRRAGCAFRPHAKTHKCPEVARRQIASGAVGVCVATVA